MRAESITVLLTGAGAPGASGVVKSLRGAGDREVEIVGVDADPDAYGFALVDEGYTVPRGDAGGYVPRMREVAAEVSADVILPLTTAELGPLAASRETFRDAGTVAMVAEPSTLSVANDKSRLYAFLTAEGFESAPAFRTVASESGFVAAAEALGYPDRPVCFKRPVASGKRGFRVLDPTSDRVDRLLHRKPDSSVTTMEDVLPVLRSAGSFPELVVMEYLPGEEYSVDVLAKGESVGPVVPRTRERTRAGISFRGTVEENDELIDESAEICRRLGLEYNVNLQFRYDGRGRPKVIEINPRISGTVVMCVGAGANMPDLGVRYALGEPLPPVDVAWGTRMTRYWQEVFHPPSGAPFRLTGSGTAPVAQREPPESRGPPASPGADPPPGP